MSVVRPEKAKAEMEQAFEQMWEELYQWRAEHAEASFDEIAAQVTPRRRALMGQLTVGPLSLSAWGWRSG